jgi:hypothetical protein
MRNLVCGVAATVLMLSAGGASAAGYLVGTGNAQNAPQVAGGSEATFDSVANGSYASVTEAGVTVSGLGGNVAVENSYAGQYNGRGAEYISNQQGNTPGILFTFSSAVSAFTFNWGAADHGNWSLEVFSGSASLGSSAVTPTWYSNAGDYIGWQAAGITSARLTSTGGYDYVFVDNVTSLGGVGGVPEPATWALMIGGFGLAGSALRRRRGAAIAV